VDQAVEAVVDDDVTIDELIASDDDEVWCEAPADSEMGRRYAGVDAAFEAWEPSGFIELCLQRALRSISS
jgi:hypothetical protein